MDLSITYLLKWIKFWFFEVSDWVSFTYIILWYVIVYFGRYEKNPVSVITFHGTNDSNIPYDGSSIFVSVNESISFWVEHNGCNLEPEINISESGRIIKRTYINGTNYTEVVLYTTVGGGHWWPGSNDDLIQEISATDCIWDFFENHPKK